MDRNPRANASTISSSKITPAPAMKIGGYTVVGKIGEGGMGAVYKAHDPALDRDLAIKILPEKLASDAEFVKRFKHEAAATAKLSHANLVQVFAAGEDAGTHFIAMEFIDGESLRDHVQRNGKLPALDALSIGMFAAEALRYAWNKAKVIHRDIKPDNILLSADGDVKVADLGLAKSLARSSVTLTTTGMVMGSPHYISPEQVQGDKDIDFRADIYSLGCTLFNMLTARAPFEGDDMIALFFKHVNEQPPDLVKLCPDCPPKLVQLVKRMMAKKPAERPATYDALIAEMSAIYKEIEYEHNHRKEITAAKSRKTNLAIYGGATAVLALVAGFFVWNGIKSGRAVSDKVDRVVPSAPSSGGNLVAQPTSSAAKPVADAFIKEVAALPAEQKVAHVMAKVKELNPDYDLSSANERHWMLDGKLDGLEFSALKLTNISPVRALMELKALFLHGNEGVVESAPLEDLSPLRGMHLAKFYCDWTRVKDLSPLEGMPLKVLKIDGTRVQDLTALRGMSLSNLWCSCTAISDLSPLKDMPLALLCCAFCSIRDVSPLTGMPLTTLAVNNNPITDLTPIKNLPIHILGLSYQTDRDTSILRSMKSLKKINELPVAEFWNQVDAGKISGADKSPVASAPSAAADDAFIKEVAALPAEEQVKRVAAKLKELNTGFDGQVTPTIEDGKVVGLAFATKDILNISPVRALSDLRTLVCTGSGNIEGVQRDLGKLKNLSAIQGLKLTKLECSGNPLSDLSPLKGMSLTKLGCRETMVADLWALENMPLWYLMLESCPVSDLSPLKNLPLKSLFISRTRVADLSPLSQVRLAQLHCNDSSVVDLSVVKQMPLREIWCDFEPERDSGILRSIKTLEQINRRPVAEFWKDLDAGKVSGTDKSTTASASSIVVDDAFIKAVAALPAEQQVVRVMTKLKELNPQFDGKETHKVEAGAVTELSISTVGVTDISPLRALHWLKKLMIAPATLTQKGALADLSALKDLPLTMLWCHQNPIRDLTPLKGMPLTTLSITGTQIADLGPLAGMKLTMLGCNESDVSDLSPLAGMPLTVFWCQNTKVSDLSPLRSTPLRDLRCEPTVAAQNAAILREIKTLAKINDLTAAAFFQKVPATTPPAPATAPRAGTQTPTYQKSSVTVLSAKHQVEKFVDEMKKLNPEWDGVVEPGIDKGKVVELKFCTIGVTNVSPVATFLSLDTLDCAGRYKLYPFNASERGHLSDLSALKDMKINVLRLGNNPIRDLSPLQGMKLRELEIPDTDVLDLSPLKGMKLTTLLAVRLKNLNDLSPLQGMPISHLKLIATSVSDLSPLHGMPLIDLNISETEVRDLSPLKGSPLEIIYIGGSKVTDLDPLRGTPLKDIHCKFVADRDGKALRSIKTLISINRVPVKEFWKRVEAGDIPKAQ